MISFLPLRFAFFLPTMTEPSDSEGKLDFDLSPADHTCSHLFNALQLPSILRYLHSPLQISPRVRTSVKTYLQLLSSACTHPKTGPQTQLYIKLNHNGKIKFGSPSPSRHEQLDRGEFVAPTGLHTSVFDHFKVKREMEGWVTWHVRDESVHPEFARVYVHLLQKFGLVEK